MNPSSLYRPKKNFIGVLKLRHDVLSNFVHPYVWQLWGHRTVFLRYGETRGDRFVKWAICLLGPLRTVSFSACRKGPRLCDWWNGVNVLKMPDLNDFLQTRSVACHLYNKYNFGCLRELASELNLEIIWKNRKGKPASADLLTHHVTWTSRVASRSGNRFYSPNI